MTYLCFPGTAANGNGTLSVWTSPGNTSPAGGNFVMADGDPAFSDTFSQTLSGLTVGQTYQVRFFQAAGQNSDRMGPTTERWQVGFGSSSQPSDLMSIPSEGMHPWTAQVLNFKADATSDVLSFLAVGTPAGAPPISFLDGVSASAVPEPTSLALSALGLIGVALLRLRRCSKLTTI